MELPQLARPKWCFTTYDIKSIDELSGCTTGRLVSTGLRTMPLEGLHSWHSGAYLLLLSQQGLNTISDDFGLARAAGG